MCNKPNMHVYVRYVGKGQEPQAANTSFGSGLGAKNRPGQNNLKNWENARFGGSGEGREQETGWLIDSYNQILNLLHKSNHKQHIHNWVCMIMSQLNLTYKGCKFLTCVLSQHSNTKMKLTCRKTAYNYWQMKAGLISDETKTIENPKRSSRYFLNIKEIKEW